MARRIGRIALRIHRLTGVILCGFFLVWFASGIVMTFSGYPYVDEGERLAAAKPLSGLARALPPAAIEPMLTDDARLIQRLGRPMYVMTRGGQRRGVWADTGEPVEPLPPNLAASVLGADVRHLETLPRGDQWTVALHTSWPVYRFAHDDPRGRESYIAAATGELVQQSDRGERVLAWLGAIPHWIYPTILRRQRGVWRGLVIALSAIGCLVCLTGLIRGVSILRRRRSGKGWTTPFTDRTLRLHHVLGLSFGLLALAWVFSGMLSLSPFAWNQGGFPSSSEQTAFRGDFDVAAFRVAPATAVAQCNAALEGQAPRVRELQLVQVAGRAYYLCLASPVETRIVPADAEQTSGTAGKHFAHTLLSEATQRLLGTAPAREELRYTADDYYYASHGDPALRLPFYRASLGERDVYVDVQRGSLLRVHTPASRWTRWLYHGLHSWDFPWLYRFRQLWHGSILAALLFGSVLSASALHLALRLHTRRRARLRRAAARRNRGDGPPGRRRSPSSMPE